jgi:hypothetical protein
MSQLYAMKTFDAALAAAYGIHDYLADGHVLSEPAYDGSVCTEPVVTPWSDGELLARYILQVMLQTDLYTVYNHADQILTPCGPVKCMKHTHDIKLIIKYSSILIIHS